VSCARGIGKAIAERFLALEIKVIVGDLIDDKS
jgi:hypothetical protein